MRRARISIKPNVRPGSRSVAPTAEVKSSQESTAVEDTQQTPTPPPQSHPEVKESAVATGDGHVSGSSSEKSPLNTNDGAPSSARTPAITAPQRRSRFSATPNLARPKVRSAASPSAGKTASTPPSKMSSTLKTASSVPQAPVPVAISRDQNSTLSNSTTAANPSPSSPCLPSTAGSPESPSCTPSLQQACQTPKRIPKEDLGPQEGDTPAPRTLSPCVKLTRVDGPGSPLKVKECLDKQRVLRALKLKELMKLERRKELMKRSERHKREHCISMDRDKMTLADFIYYLPESNPMKKSTASMEESKTQSTAPLSPVVQKNSAEAEEEDEDEDDDEMLVPKVRVAEDGSLILDEDSLTVRVQRTSKTVVDNGNPLFERGSTTTYSSFRKSNYVKMWSVRETDMFYLAISMVGTDFSMIAQLLTHRTRAEIRRKFRKEEKENAWRVDKAFTNKRPYDAEFFGFLLKRILAKDKEKGKAIKLVVKSNKPKRAKGGKKAKQRVDKDSINHDDDDDELCSVDSACLDLEKENEDNSNVKKADLPLSTSKKRKRTKDTKPCEKTCEPRKKKNIKKKGKCPVENEDGDLVCGDSVVTDGEGQSCLTVSKKKRKPSKNEDQEGQEEKTDGKEKRQKKKKKKLEDLSEDPAEGESGTINEEHSEESTTKKQKQSKTCPEEDKKPTKRKASSKKSKTPQEVLSEEPADGESGAVNEEHSDASTTPTKKRKHSKKCPEDDKKPAKSKTSQEECSGSELGADGSEVSTAALSVEEDQGEKLDPESAAQEEISQISSKRSKGPVPNLAKRKAKKGSEPKATVEIEGTVDEAQDESCREAESELRIVSVAEKQLQSQPVVVLERTPPRLKDSQSSSESQDHPQSPQSPQRSPGRQMRAEKVKRNLTVSDDGSEALKAGLCAEQNQREKLTPEHADQEEITQSFFESSSVWQAREEKVEDSLMASEEEMMDECQTGSDTSPEVRSSAAVPDHVIIRNSKQMEADQRMEEGVYLPHLEFLTTSEVNGKTLLERAVVLVSREEVERYLRIQAQTNADESESQQDKTSARARDEGDHSDGHEEQGSSGVALEKRLSKDPEMKESNTASVSAQQKVTEKRRFSKPTPNLSRTGQSCHSPLNEHTTEFRQHTSTFKYDSTQPQGSSDVEDSVNAEVMKEGLEQEHREPPEEEGTCSVTPEEKSSLDVKVQDDVKPAVDDLPSALSVETPPRVIAIEDQGVSSFLEKPQVPDTTPSDKDIPERRTELEKSPSHTFENEDQEEEESEPSESGITDSVIGEPDLQTSEPEEDPAEIPEHERAGKNQPCDMNHDIETFSRDETLLSSELDLQECKQDEDLLSPVLLLGSTQTSVPQIPVDCTGKGNQEQTDVVLSDAASVLLEPHSPDSSFSDHPTEHTSNMCDADTVMFSESAAEDTQIPDEQVSQNQDDTEKQSTVTEDCSVNLDETAKSEILERAGLEKGSPAADSFKPFTDVPQCLFEADNQSEEEPTFILTLYEIPASQLFQEAVSGQQDTPPYELQPAQVHTPSLFSQSTIPFTLQAHSESLHMVSVETEKPSKSTFHENDSLVPLSKDASDAKDAGTPLTSSQESSCDDVNSLISAPEMLSCNSATPTDVLRMNEKLTETSNTKAPTHRRSKIKVKPNLKPGVKAGPSRKGQLDSARTQSLSSPHAKAQTEMESNQKTSAQEMVDTESPEDRKSKARDGHDSVISMVSVSEEEEHVKGESPLRTIDQMDEDVDSPVHSTAVKESKEETEDVHESDSHMTLADFLEMEDVFNKDVDCAPQKAEDLSVCFPDREETLSAVNDQREKVADISEEPDTCSEPSGVTSSADQEKSVPFRRGKLQIKPKIPKKTSTEDDFPRQKQSDVKSNDPSSAQIVSPPLIKGELEEKVEERMERVDFSEDEFNTRLSETSECTHLPPLEPKIKDGTGDVSHVVLSDILVPVSDEIKDDDHAEGRRFVLQMGEESKQALEQADEEQDTHSHEGVSHMLLTDILIPVCEDMSGDLSQEPMTAGERSPHEAETPQVREDPDNPDLLYGESQSSNVGPSTSPNRKGHTQRKGKLFVKMAFPKRKAGDSPKGATLSSPEPECSSEPKCASTQNSLVSFTECDLLPIGSEDREEACGDVSHMILSDILLPVLDEIAECSLQNEELSVGLQEDTVKVKKSTDIESPAITERDEMTSSQSVSVEWKTPSCRRSTLRPKPKFSKRKEDLSESDLHLPGSTPQQSLDPQAEEWSLRSNMLPVDSDEIENWCEGVSHMLLSDAFVPVSEETGEKSTDTKVLASSSLQKVEERTVSRPSNETPSEISDKVDQLHITTDVSKTDMSQESVPAPLAKKSPARSTFQMTLRSPERRLKDQPHVLKSPQSSPKTPQRPQTLKVKESMGSPTRGHTGEISSVCRVQLERLTVEEICAAQPKHHSTPVTVKTRGNEMHKASPALHGNVSPALGSHVGKETLPPLGYSPKVVLHRIPITGTDANTSSPTVSPVRVSSMASSPPADLQSLQNSPIVSDVETDMDPNQVSQFFLDDIFTEVVDPD